MQLGMIGLGRMGANIVRRLQHAGHTCVVYDHDTTAVKALAGESDRRILWLPVFFGTGIALYFALTFEPVGWAGLGATGAAIALVSLLWRHPAGRDAAIAFPRNVDPILASSVAQLEAC